MHLSPEQQELLAGLGEALLRAFEAIAREVRSQLGQAQPPPNPLLPAPAQQKLEHILSENRQGLRLLQREPAIARVEVQWADTERVERLYICRASSAGVFPPELEGRLVSYRAALGRLAEIPAGDSIGITLPKGTREAKVLERVHVHPIVDEAGWDSHENEFDLVELQVVIDSIRRLLEHAQRSLGPEARVDFIAQLLAEDEARALYQAQRRRKTVDRMALRDQPVLDQFQGAVFRMPLDKKVVLLGPPGTGKTTTLIRRLAQKQTQEALTEEELHLLDRRGIKEEFMGGLGWAMFSPTELLKLYVREAFNREGIPAANWNLRTWDAERITLGRDILRFLKGASTGRYTIANNDDILTDAKSPSLAALHDDFAGTVDREIMERCDDALQLMEESEHAETQRVLSQIRSRHRTTPLTVDAIHAFADDSETFRANITTLTNAIDMEQRTVANKLLAPKPDERLRELSKALQRGVVRPSDSDEEEEEEDETTETMDRATGTSESFDQAGIAKFLLRCIRRLAQHAVEGRAPQATGDFATFNEWLGDRMPRAEQLLDLGQMIRLRKQLRTLEGAARSLVFDVPGIYTRYRRRCIEQGRWYKQDEKAASAMVLSPAEVDILLLVMLRHARRALEQFPDSSWLKPIEGRYLMQVFVDEATDFSCIQLACTLELSHPSLRSWFACGDFRQRITSFGISDPHELNWIQAVTHGGAIEAHTITVDYRQSARLKALAEALATGSVRSDDAPFSSSHGDDPVPLLIEHIGGDPLASWLAERILEVERSVGRLPSIAVFVDGEHRIDPLVGSIGPLLARHNIRIVGCRDGRDVGNVQEVRVFDVQHIKGLEFEAVFFVAIDALAERLPSLFDKYLYVGITRAATFLGVTCENELPRSLNFLRSLFSQDQWS